VIRTDPKERSYAYVSGVKLQAGQEKSLVEDGFLIEHADGSSGAKGNHKNSLDALEAAIVRKKNGKAPLTEIEELEALRKLNERASAEGNDVDHNALIRKTFRTDRREHRRRLVGGTSLGWKAGMALLPSSDGDVLASKEAVYGRASSNERKKLSGVRKSSIFDSKPSRRQRKKRQHRDPSSNSAAAFPDAVGSSEAPDAVPSRPLPDENDLPSPPSTPDKPSSSSDTATHRAPKQTLKLSNGSLSVAPARKGGIRYSSSNNQAPKESNHDNTNANAKAPSSLLELMGAYGSSDDDDDDDD